MKHLFLLEDDVSLSQTISDYLIDEGFSVTVAYDGVEAQDLLYETTYDLLLLDVNVPPPDGFELLKALRSKGMTTPAIFLTSRDALSDVETGFTHGCDDYIRKPFALKELLLRIQTIIKRDFFHQNSARRALDAHLSYDTQGDLLYYDDTPLALHAKEKRLLQLFLKHPNQLVTHEMIVQSVWDYDETASEASVRTYIKNLRKILGKDRIESIKRLGYKFSAQ